MEFMKRHLYITWQIIGFAILIMDGTYIWFNINNENISYPFVVITSMVAGFIIILSPMVIKLNKKNSMTKELSFKDEIEHYILHLHTWDNGYKSELITSLIMAFVLILFTMVTIYFGIPFFAPLSFYMAVLIYILWKKYILSKFYKVKNAEENCEIIEVKDLSFLDILYKSSAITYFKKPEPEMLCFLYNRLNNKELLKDEKLKIYTLTSVEIKEKYNIDMASRKKFLMCVLPEDLNIENNDVMNFKVDYSFGSSLFDSFVDRGKDFICCMQCPVCGEEDYGSLQYLTEKSTGNMFLYCDCCDACYDSPEDAQNDIISEIYYGRSRASTIEEIREADWEEYINE